MNKADQERDGLLARAGRVVSRIQELAAISEDAQVLSRRYGTPAFAAAARQVLAWMRDAGLRARIDAIGNVRGVLPSGKAGAGTMIIASHIDTVVNAGRWDGPLGVLMGLDLLEKVNRAESGFPFDIELIAFCDEEGVRFHTTYLGSKVVAGSFDREILHRKDAEGISLEQAIREIGGDPAALGAEAIAPGSCLGYFEIHIEQGPVLYEQGVPVAPVTAIAGQVRAQARFVGMAGHAGTVPMDMRQDALCAAAEFVLAAERIGLGGAGRLGGRLAGDASLVVTVGKLEIRDAASNVIPGAVSCTVDIRSDDADILSLAHEQVRTACMETGRQRGVTVDWEVLQSSLPVCCDRTMGELLAASIKSCGYACLPLVSGAGHDAVPVSAVAPVCMLFVRCYKGISHNPLENVETTDIAAALAVTDNFLQRLSAFYDKAIN